MKKTLPPPSERSTGPTYWRSLDQLAETPEFRQWVEREFPEGASEFHDPVSRRHFVKIMSASFMLAGLGLTGCRRPEETILPFADQPQNYIHGVPQHYATAMPNRSTAVPLVVKSSDGRPTKVEGNKLHPDSNGGTDLHAQASLLSLYDPDRAQRFAKGGNTVSREEALDFLRSVAARFSAREGRGLAFLGGQSSSPSRRRLEGLLREKFPRARFYRHEPADLETGAEVATLLAGKRVRPLYQLDQAKILLTLDFDLVGGEADAARHIRDFAKGRRLVDHTSDMSRLYAVESLLTLTGANADHRLRVPSSGILAVAAALAAELAPDNAPVRDLAAKATLPQGVKRAWIVECAKDLAAHKGESVILAGHRQPPAVHALAALLNAVLNNNGRTVFYPDWHGTQAGTLSELAKSLKAGDVDTLVILEANPALTAPADLDWTKTQRQANTVVRLGYYEDETFPLCDWHLPAAHYLESWGDGRTADGTLVPIQPLVAPLFGGLTDLEVLARVGDLDVTRPHDIARETYQAVSGDDSENGWKKFLHDGFLAGSQSERTAPSSLNLEAAATLLAAAAAPPMPGAENLEVVFHRDSKVDDGRYSNNGWLQELPDPLTKVTWDNVITLSRKTAAELGLKNGDVVEVALEGRSLEGPVWIQPGQADYSLGLALGYGRRQGETGGTGRVGHGVGMYNAYAVRTSKAPHIARGATIKQWTGRTYTVATTQNHGAMEGRPIVREANLKEYREHPNFVDNIGLAAHTGHVPHDPETGQPKKIYEHPYEAYADRKSQVGVDLSNRVIQSDVHQWGMSIDLNACVGCTSCVMACQSENNIPIVGKDQVNRDREMQWIRIDRYFSSRPDADADLQVDDPQVVHQPMLCQHCENAPCESVCPVNATVHDAEGLNVMAYNRCVGTRYCSNNCPYKVRRFNFFDYHKHTPAHFYKTPLATSSDGKWNMTQWFRRPAMHHTVPEDEWELLKLVRNPDVSVRMRGVMEKCTFCTQRIEQAKIEQKNRVGQSGGVQVPEGAFETACQQACPADAIVFGNLLDPESRVSKLKKHERDYTVLEFLDNRPRVTYLARIRNPNPAMPDAYAHPLTLQEYMDRQHADPFKEHHGPDEGGHAAGKGGAH